MALYWNICIIIKCVGWSESSIGTHVRWYVFCRCDSNEFRLSSTQMNSTKFDEMLQKDHIRENLISTFRRVNEKS